MGEHNESAAASSTTSPYVNVCRENVDFVCAILDGRKCHTEPFKAVAARVHEMVQDQRASTEEKQQMYLRLFRLAHFCPFEDVRTICRALVSELKGAQGLTFSSVNADAIRPSRFEDTGSFPEFEWDNQLWSSIFRKNVGRILSIHWSLSFHMPFLEKFSTTMNALMIAEGPLLPPWRSYLAMMACTPHDCEYLVRFQQEMFLSNGGDPQWLEDASCVPAKLLAMEELNVFLCHTPYKLTAKHLRTYLNPDDASLRWSIQELLAACCILAVYHGLCTFAFAMGLRPEEQYCEDLQERFIVDDNSPQEIPLCFLRFVQDPMRRRLVCISEKACGELVDPTRAEGQNKEAWVNAGKLSEAGKTMTLEEKQSLGQVMECRPQVTSPASDEQKAGIRRAWAQRFGSPSEEWPDSYMDFGNKGFSPVSQFLWDEAFTLLSQFFPDGADAINDEWNYVNLYTDSQINGVQVVSTAPVRRAMQMYVFRLFGLILDDYNYSKLNKFLPLTHKVTLKKMICYPQRVTIEDYNRIRRFDEFGVRDMAHYCLLIAGCRRTLELQFVLYNLQQYQTVHWDDDSSET